MKRAIGLGGLFFKSEKPKELAAWYQKHLGINIEQFGGAVLNWKQQLDDCSTGYTVWSPFKADTDYFNPSKSEFMMNFVVDDLDALLPVLKEEGVELSGEPTNDPNFGKFAGSLTRKVER
jgi:predicted enzyme related to lactoylglutathione lyase